MKITKKFQPSNGYVCVYDPSSGKQRKEHLFIVENNIGRKLTKSEIIHHIDGNKINNQIDNLCLCHNNREHGLLHSQLEDVAFKLFNKGVIKFDYNNKRYYINPVIDLCTLETSLEFDDMAICQKKNVCDSRLKVKIDSEVIKGVKRPIPLIASNMSTVINPAFYKILYDLGALGVLHRACANEELLNNVSLVAETCKDVAASIGIDDNQFDLSLNMIDRGCTIIFIDVAHGYSNKVISLGRKIKNKRPDTKIVIGNVTNPNILPEICDFADGLKVGIAQGLACETKDTAGCEEKQFSAVFKFRDIANSYGIPIISDGGIRKPSDFVKAIGAGASSVMAGSIFARCPESAGEIIATNNGPKKLYAGMASRYVQEKWKGSLKSGTCPEGKVVYLDLGEPCDKLIERYAGALRSGITYAGFDNINSFRLNCEFIRHYGPFNSLKINF